MIHIRSTALAALLAGTIVSGPALAQTSTPSSSKAKDTKSMSQPAPAPAKDKDAKSDSSTVTSVENWSRKQWNAMTKEWSKDKAKWTDCRKQSTDQKLSGRKSWSFLYQCMKKA
jgi:hypothetical protein